MALNILETALAAFAVLCLWAGVYDSNRFVVVRRSLNDKRIRKPFRAVLLADLHNKEFGKGNERLLAAIREQAPDMILVAGDVLTAKKGRTPRIALELMKELAALAPVYYGNGNHEYRLGLYPERYGSMGAEYAKALENLGVHLLVNDHVCLEEYGVSVYGLEIDRRFYRRFHLFPMEGDYLEQTMGTPEAGLYTILLAHNPDYFPSYAEWGADVTFSGHVHGGVIRVFGKGLLSPMVRFFPKYDGGLYSMGDKCMLVSRGLSSHTLPLRIFNPGELIVIDFAAEKDR